MSPCQMTIETIDDLLLGRAIEAECHNDLV
jgi:hypothetical protein